MAQPVRKSCIDIAVSRLESGPQIKHASSARGRVAGNPITGYQAGVYPSGRRPLVAFSDAPLLVNHTTYTHIRTSIGLVLKQQRGKCIFKIRHSKKKCEPSRDAWQM
ncbi:hypothetical protein EVAR_67601_1 [Eumeta japonica]|uniref:Uncharacterized protein n=1 Tax=Eumeta variegata TaxID=151549 RepID=A0A4C1ZS27_EUMVA|nr:hypothetical protein EVAR_67601_1 [Eumeta japonica]